MQIVDTLPRLFPLVLAPAVVRIARATRLRWLDGALLVWLAVAGAGVAWTVVIGLATGEAISRAMVARGLLMGLAAAAVHTLATGKGRGLLPAQPNAAPPKTVSLPMPDAPPTEVAPVDITPANTGAQREMDLDWGSPKDGVRGAGEAREG